MISVEKQLLKEALKHSWDNQSKRKVSTARLLTEARCRSTDLRSLVWAFKKAHNPKFVWEDPEKIGVMIDPVTGKPALGDMSIDRIRRDAWVAAALKLLETRNDNGLSV